MQAKKHLLTKHCFDLCHTAESFEPRNTNIARPQKRMHHTIAFVQTSFLFSPMRRAILPILISKWMCSKVHRACWTQLIDNKKVGIEPVGEDVIKENEG